MSILQFIFVPKPDSSFDSLTVPLHNILSTRFEQPTFGSNYLAFEVKPSGQEGSGLTNGTQVELRFKDRAIFEFVALLEKTRERAIYMKRQELQDNEEGLRTLFSFSWRCRSNVHGGCSDVYFTGGIYWWRFHNGRDSCGKSTRLRCLKNWDLLDVTCKGVAVQ